MAVINANGTLSGMYIESKLTITEKSRSSSNVVLNITIETHLQTPSSYLGIGYTLSGVVTAYGISKTITLKSTSTVWSGNKVHSKKTTMTISVPATVTNITIGYKTKMDGDTVTGSNTTLALSRVLAVLTSATDFSDTTNPIMYFNNPSGFKIRPRLTFYTSSGGTQLLRIYPSDISTTGQVLNSPYEWVLSESERNQIRDALKTLENPYCAVGIETYNSNVKLGESSRAVKFNNQLSPPLFDNFEYVDTNSVTTALTGNNSKIIKDYSTLKITISGDNKAQAQKGASISYYSIEGKQYDYQDNFSVEIEKWDKEKISIYAIDSRGVSTLVEKDCDFVSYEPVGKKNISAMRDGGVSVQTKLSYSGVFWNNSFGSITNSISVTYKYKVAKSSSYINGISAINPTITGNSFAFNDYILGDSNENGFNIENSYEIVVEVEDKLSKIEFSTILQSGIPAISVYKNNISLHGKYDKNLGGTQINGDLFLNGKRLIGCNYIQITRNADQEFTVSANGFSAFTGGTYSELISGDSLFREIKPVSFEDRTDYSVTGITIGKNISTIKATAEIRYRNMHSADMSISTMLYRLRNGSVEAFGGASQGVISLYRYTCNLTGYIDVEEGDFIFCCSHKAVKESKVTVQTTDKATRLIVESVE